MKKKFSLKNQILIILLVFIVTVLAVIYFSQTALLDTFYKNNKIRDMKHISETICDGIENNNIEEVTNEYIIHNDVSIRIVSDTLNLTSYSKSGFSVLDSLSDIQIAELYIEAKQNNNQKLFENVRYEMIPGMMMNGMYILASIENINNSEVLILVASNIMPLDVTEKTISDQFVLLAIIVIIMTMVLAVVMSRFIVKPLKAIENEAKLLPIGKYDKNNIKAPNQELDSFNNTLANANDEINKADIAKKELLANVSHDLRTPLTMIAGYGELMKDIPEEKNDDNIDIIISEAKRLSSLVSDLLDVSRWQSGKVKLDKKETKVNLMLKAVYKQYGVYCKSQGIKFKLSLDKEFEAKIDEERIKQVLYNFLNNAINYNTKKNKEIKLGVGMIDNKHRVYVYDNGDGIDKKDISKVFDRYYKVDKEHIRASIGSGIGLSLSKEILVAHKLNYGVESEVGKYSKFYFDL